MLGRFLGDPSRSRAALAREAHALGATIESTQELDVGTHGDGAGVRQLAKLAVTGDAATVATRLELHHLSVPSGRFLYVLPFQNQLALAGFYHFVVPGEPEQPAVHVRRIFGGTWATNDDAALRARFDSSAPLRAALKRLPWAKQTAIGAIRFDWKVQLRALGDGTTHVVVQAGSHHLDVHHQSLAEAAAVVAALEPLLTASHGVAQGLYFDRCYEDLILS